MPPPGQNEPCPVGKAGALVTPGQRVQRVRKAHALSLMLLADRSGLSLGTLSNIERGIQGLTMRSVVALSRALGLPSDWFLDGRGEPGGVVQRRQQGRTVAIERGIHKELLNPDISGELELLLVTIAPGGTSGEEAYTHRGEEAGHVLSGTLALWVDDVSLMLAAGDSFHFQSNRPHRFANGGAGEAKVLWALTPPLYQSGALT